jgi:diguanylate cyclase (GGDEF)-like protein
MKILIADDRATDREQIESLLREDGNEVIGVADGDAAWRALQVEDPPRIALLDWILPGLHAIEVCRRARQHIAHPYIFLMLLAETHPTQEDLIIAMENGADDYLAKPFHEQELRVRLYAARRIVELQDKLTYLAMHDSLTGALNHAAILETLAREAARAIREGEPLGVILADLDGFRQVNEAHGHIAGDAVLVETTCRLATGLRPYDELGRYGGEEFLIVAPNCDAREIVQLAERLRQRLATAPVSTGTGQVAVTASFGVAASERGRPDPDALLRAVDKALYAAKNAGRNCVAAEPGTDSGSGAPG